MPTIETCLGCDHHIPQGDAVPVVSDGRLVGFVHSHRNSSFGGRPCHDAMIRHFGATVLIDGRVPVLSRTGKQQKPLTIREYPIDSHSRVPSRNTGNHGARRTVDARNR